MPSFRRERVASLLRQELARILREDVKDPGLGPDLTISRIKVSQDLRHATVFYTVLGGDEARRKAVPPALERCLGFIRARVGRAVQMRVTPDLRFVHDDSFADAMRVSEALQRIQKDPAPAAEAPEDPSEPPP